jgi:predicted PurR-regulated permease PerM
MSPELYAITGVGVSTLGFLSALTAVIFYLFSQVNRRIDRLEERIDRLEDTFIQRMNRLEDKIDRLQEQVTDLDKRLMKLEWTRDYEATQRLRPNPPDVEE